MSLRRLRVLVNVRNASRISRLILFLVGCTTEICAAGSKWCHVWNFGAATNDDSITKRRDKLPTRDFGAEIINFSFSTSVACIAEEESNKRTLRRIPAVRKGINIHFLARLCEDSPAHFARVTRHYMISWAFRLFKAAINVRRNPERVDVDPYAPFTPVFTDVPL